MKSLVAAAAAAAASLSLFILPPCLAFQSNRIPGSLAAGTTKKNNAALLSQQSRLFAFTMSDNDVDISTTSTSKKQPFESFDYNSQWYPVTWARDVPINQPIRVTLFDVDYVLAKTMTTSTSSQGSDDDDDEVFFAMIDRCPHKKVALSEGRITECGDKRYFQCSYHGWTFDGENGECTEIPQTLIAQQNSNKPSSSYNQSPTKKTGTNNRRRDDATAIAVRVVQGMVWLHPSRTPLEALAAMEMGELLPPPRVPEMDVEGYRSTPVVRDFPIDWTVLMENIMDPDHGHFAHSSSGMAKGFDWYSSDGVDNQVQVKEDFSDEGGWKITSSVNAVEKLVKYNRDVRSANKDESNSNKATEETPKKATTTLIAPSSITMGRRVNSTDLAPFVTAFWVCPTGTGKSRFMSAAIGKTPFSIPRWLIHININNFLDQDTFLLCGQHRAVLEREAEGYLRGEDTSGVVGGSDSSGTTTTTPNIVRKSTYVYRSPSEKMPVKVGQFFDATLSRAPNRKEGVLAWYGKNSNNHKLLESWPSREVVLDRYAQHTKICQDSMDVVKNCDKVIGTSKTVALALTFMKMVWQRSSPTASVETALKNPFVSGITVAAIRQMLARSTSIVCSLTSRIGATLLRDKAFYSILALAFLSHSLASRVKREFFFKFDEELHRTDVKAIAKNWMDL